jgi:hypothetical protein
VNVTARACGKERCEECEDEHHVWRQTCKTICTITYLLSASGQHRSRVSLFEGLCGGLQAPEKATAAMQSFYPNRLTDGGKDIIVI